jgi:hypothetical protein
MSRVFGAVKPVTNFQHFGKVMSELFRNALWLNYLEKPSELKFLGSE